MIVFYGGGYVIHRLQSKMAPCTTSATCRLQPFALNIYMLVLVVNPVSPEAAQLVDVLLQMWQGMYPLKMGECQLNTIRL